MRATRSPDLDAPPRVARSSAMRQGRRWVVGMDLSKRSHGALRFARWLHERSALDERLCGVHVMRVYSGVRDQPGMGRALDRMRGCTRASAAKLQVASVFDGFEVIPGDPAEQELARIATMHDFFGIILGRAAPGSGWSLVSLGRVTRRLLRRVPRPLVVVPPDLDPRTLGRGPIVVGVVPEHHALAAARLGARLSEQLGLGLVLVHVVDEPTIQPVLAPTPELMCTPPPPRPSPKQKRQRDEAKLRTWLEDRELDQLDLRVERGRGGQRLLDVATAMNASAIVCGSRRLSLLDRILGSSTGSTLAARADRPVIVVPPEEDLIHLH